MHSERLGEADRWRAKHRVSCAAENNCYQELEAESDKNDSRTSVFVNGCSGPIEQPEVVACVRDSSWISFFIRRHFSFCGTPAIAARYGMRKTSVKIHRKYHNNYAALTNRAQGHPTSETSIRTRRLRTDVRSD